MDMLNNYAQLRVVVGDSREQVRRKLRAVMIPETAIGTADDTEYAEYAEVVKGDALTQG